MTILHVKLTPKASADRIGDTRPDAEGHDVLQVYVTAVPENGKANEAMIRLIAKHFAIAPSHVVLLRGHTSRHKVIEIPDE